MRRSAGPILGPRHGAPRTERNGEDRAAVLEARIAEMIEAQRLRDDVIADLRERLDRSESERPEAQARVAVLLADQRQPTTDSSQSKWRRLLRALGHVQ